MGLPTEICVALVKTFADQAMVFCRLLGLFVLLPGLSTPAFGWQLRCVLILTLAAIITPNVSVNARTVLTVDAPIHVSRENEGNGNVLETFSEPRDVRHESNESEAAEIQLIPEIHRVIAEFCLGLLLGCGANLILQGARMAGTLIEQQSGLTLSGSLEVDQTDPAAGGSELYFWLGTLFFLLAGGHFLFLSALLETFRHFPVGFGNSEMGWAVALASLIHQSLNLAIKLAAPVIATQILINSALSYAANAIPVWGSHGVVIPIRTTTAILVVVMSLFGAWELIRDVVPSLIETTIEIKGTPSGS